VASTGIEDLTPARGRWRRRLAIALAACLGATVAGCGDAPSATGGFIRASPPAIAVPTPDAADGLQIAAPFEIVPPSGELRGYQVIALEPFAGVLTSAPRVGLRDVGEAGQKVATLLVLQPTRPDPGFLERIKPILDGSDPVSSTIIDGHQVWLISGATPSAYYQSDDRVLIITGGAGIAPQAIVAALIAGSR
jgi:hypothetical protein